MLQATRSLPEPASTSTRPAAPAGPTPAEAAAAFDQLVHARAAALTSGLSPISLSLAWQDWAQHLMSQPGQRLRLAAQAQAGVIEWLGHCASGGCTPDGSAAAPDLTAPPGPPAPARGAKPTPSVPLIHIGKIAAPSAAQAEPLKRAISRRLADMGAKIAEKMISR